MLFSFICRPWSSVTPTVVVLFNLGFAVQHGERQSGAPGQQMDKASSGPQVSPLQTQMAFQGMPQPVMYRIIVSAKSVLGAREFSNSQIKISPSFYCAVELVRQRSSRH